MSNLEYFTNIKTNLHFFQTIPGIVRLSELIFGIICFTCILCSSSGYYDPFLGRNVNGFAGGSIEILFLLNSYSCLFCTTLVILSTLISTTTGTSASRIGFRFIYHIIVCLIYLALSLSLLIEVSKRNKGYPVKEPGYTVKIVASVFGLLASLCYLLSAMFTFKTSSPPEDKNYFTSKLGSSFGLGSGEQFSGSLGQSGGVGTSRPSSFLRSWVCRVFQIQDESSHIYDEISIPVPSTAAPTTSTV